MKDNSIKSGCKIVSSIKKKITTTKKCEWSGKFNYATGCGKEFFDATESGEPVTDWLSFCPFCGVKVELRK